MTGAKTKETAIDFCFVLSPIGSAGTSERQHADWVLNGLIKEALSSIVVGGNIVRGDEDDSPGIITNHIIECIVRANLIVCDLTFLNPNVFYELGIVHALRKPTIHMARVGTQLPFDNTAYRTIFFDQSDWKSVQDTRNSIKQQAQRTLSEDFSLSNPYISALNYQKISTSADPKEKIIADMAEKLERLELRLESRIEFNKQNLRSYPEPWIDERVSSIILQVASRNNVDLDSADFVTREIIKNKEVNKLFSLYGKRQDKDILDMIDYYRIPF